MNHYFKEYLKNTVTGALTGASLGSLCGAAAGVAGLMEGVCYQLLSSSDADHLIKMAAIAGVGSGIATGSAVGAICYPAYKLFSKRFFPEASEVVEAGLEDLENVRFSSVRL